MSMTDDELKAIQQRDEIARSVFGPSYDENGGEAREFTDLMGDRDRGALLQAYLALLAREAARGEVVQMCSYCTELNPRVASDCWSCRKELRSATWLQRVPKPEA